ncbi:MAG: discoidin domain-containing protein, partial [Phycisphaerae bacterium]
MCRKLFYLVSFVLVLGLASSASALVVKSGETVTYDSRTRIPDGNTVVEAGGTLIFKDRVDFDAGDELHVYGTVISEQRSAFPDSGGCQDVKAFIYKGGLWDCYEMRNRGGERCGWITIFPGGTLIVRTSYGSGDPTEDASFWIDDGSLLPAEYIVFTDLGSGAVEITNGRVIEYAAGPIPPDGATDVPRDVILSWTPGPFAAAVNGHTVYFSESFEDVNNGIGGIAQDANTYDPPGLLEFGQTYYWRVDEVNDLEPSSPLKGVVWSFTVEPYSYLMDKANIIATASSSQSIDTGPQKTIDGSGLSDGDLHSTNAKDMWLSNVAGPQPTWIEYEFDRIYKLHEMWVWNQNQVVESTIGFGAKDVTIEYSTDGVDWLAMGNFEFAQAPGLDDYAHDTTVDFGVVAARYVRLTVNSNWGGIINQYGLSEVRFFHIPVFAREPDPASGATDMGVDNVTLRWRAGREAALHNVYFGTDEQAVIDETISPVSIPAGSSYANCATGPLVLGQSYYWKVNEVNEAETPATWQGDVWNFSTQEYLVVDDIEDYNDFEPDRIFDTWVDGWGVPENGSQVGSD